MDSGSVVVLRLDISGSWRVYAEVASRFCENDARFRLEEAGALKIDLNLLKPCLFLPK